MTGTQHGLSGAGARSDRPRADRDRVLAVLREHASDETLAQMGPRYGIHAEQSLGVPMAAMKRIARDVGRDHALATELWATAIYEARIVAALVDEPERVTLEQMDGLVCRLRQLGALRHRLLLAVRPGTARLVKARALGTRRPGVRATGVVRPAVEPGPARHLGRRCPVRRGPGAGGAVRRGPATAGHEVDVDVPAGGRATQPLPAGGRPCHRCAAGPGGQWTCTARRTHRTAGHVLTVGKAVAHVVVAADGGVRDAGPGTTGSAPDDRVMSVAGLAD